MKHESYWLDTASRGATTPHDAFPARTDLLIVGAGFTGLAAARAAAARGVGVVVIDADRAVSQASGRNGGHVNNGTAGSFSALAGRVGLDHACTLYRFFDDAVDTVQAIVADEAIDCDFRRSGKLRVAWTDRHFDALKADQDFVARHVDADTALLERDEVAAELGSDAMRGGFFYRRSGQMHVGRFGAALLRAAMGAGAQVFENTPMVSATRVHGAWQVTTPRGVIQTDKVLLATGTSRQAPSWFRRRIMPVGSFIVATEPLDENLFASVLPAARNVVTTRHIHNYFRTTPDRRLIFGGRANFRRSGAVADRRSGDILHAALVEIYPQLAQTRIAYCWGGNVDMSVDRLPHAGEHDGLIYALGLSGHGVQMSVHLGSLLGQRIAGEMREIPFWNTAWAPIPAYGLASSFMPVVGAYYRLRDWLE